MGSASSSSAARPQPPRLRRELGLFGAVMTGLGSIVGTGVFVSIGIAAGVAGPAVILAIALAALVAACNALSSAQLAAANPVSGGTYEYGYVWLGPRWGFAAGWMFLLAKTASAATAALGFAGYLLNTLWPNAGSYTVPVALAAVAGLTAVVLAGIRRSSATNAVVVSITLLALLAFIVAGAPAAIEAGGEDLQPFLRAGPDELAGPIGALLHATALMFVAYTGYGRIATLGEEVREPRRTIPRAIVITLLVSAALYVSVALVATAAVGADALHAATRGRAAPLETVARTFGAPGIPTIVSIGAMTAMLGVLLNLVLGLSRVLLAMGRRGDMPAAVAVVSRSTATPHVAVLVVGVAIAALAGIGSVRVTWSFSAFTVLLYYAITNAAALRLPAEQRLFPRWIAAAGLLACLGLAFWVELSIWLTGLALLVLGLIWQAIMRRLAARG